MCVKRTESTVWALSSAITSWKRGKRSYGTPPPSRKHSTMSSSTVESVGIHCAVDREVVGRRGARQPGGVLGRERVARRLGLELDDASGRHRAEPLADVALVEPGGVGELLARRAAVLGQRVEQARAMADGHHHHQRAAVQHVEHAPGERLGALVSYVVCGHSHLLVGRGL